MRGVFELVPEPLAGNSGVGFFWYAVYSRSVIDLPDQCADRAVPAGRTKNAFTSLIQDEPEDEQEP
jgi:hypothetical protein